MPTSSENAALCGGFAICILICLYVIGLPMFIAGIVLLTSFDYFDDGGIRTAGIVLVVISSIFIIAGIVTSAMAIYHCSKSSASGGGWRNPGTVFVGQNPNYTTQGVQPQYGQGPMVYTTQSTTGQALVVQQQYPQATVPQYPQQYPPPAYQTNPEAGHASIK